MSIFLGIDPGSRKLGYGLIYSTVNKLEYLAHGVLEIPLHAMPLRLGFIYKELSQIILKYKPQYFAIEEVFVHKNVNSALKLGQARGVAILTAVNNNIEVYEYSPRAIKQAVVGNGGADKHQVQQMVKILLNLLTLPATDAADALAVAICAANNMSNLTQSNAQTQNLIKNYSKKYSRGRWR